MTELLRGAIKIWSPQASEVFGELQDAVATCVSAAFSGGVWTKSPIPLGHEGDRDSAHGIIAGLHEKSLLIMVASNVSDQLLIGCVLGGILDTDLICAYRLGAYGAGPGDGLLAYIGVLPSAQGTRVTSLFGHTYETLTDHRRGRVGDSLAGQLFARWLDLPAVKDCPRIFIRTRKEIPAVLHLIEKNGFEYCGKFELAFRGGAQQRLVFKRNSALFCQQEKKSAARGQG